MASHLYDGAMRPRRHQALRAGACYFLVTLALSWICGPVRDYWVRAGAEMMLAILCQAVVTLLILVWAAGWVVEIFDVPVRLSQRATVGFGAIGLLLVFNFLSSYLIFRMTPWELAAQVFSPEGVVVAAGLLIAAVLPIVRGRRADG